MHQGNPLRAEVMADWFLPEDGCVGVVVPIHSVHAPQRLSDKLRVRLVCEAGAVLYAVACCQVHPTGQHLGESLHVDRGFLNLPQALIKPFIISSYPSRYPYIK